MQVGLFSNQTTHFDTEYKQNK